MKNLFAKYRIFLQSCVLAAIATLNSGCGCQNIQPGEVGIKFDASTGLSQRVVKPKVEFYGPFERLFRYPTSIQNATFTKNSREGEKIGDDSIAASTIEGAQLPVDVTVSFHVNSGDVLKVFDNFGNEEMPNIKNEYIRWVTIYAINVVSGGRPIFDLISKDRASFGADVKTVVTEILEPWGITVDNVLIGELYPDKGLSEKIQESINIRTELDTVKTTLQQSRVDAETTIINANKQAELNRLLSLQGEKVLELQNLELRKLAIEKWNGTPPLIGDGTIPFTTLAPK